MVIALFSLTNDSNLSIAKDSVLCLINLTADEDGAIKIFQTAKQVHPVYDFVCKFDKKKNYILMEFFFLLLP